MQQRLNRCWPAQWVVAVLLWSSASSAYAMNVDGKFGIGFEETLIGVGVRQGSLIAGSSSGNTAALPASGMAFRYHFGNIGIEAIVGASMRSTLGGTGDLQYTALASGGLFYNAVRAPSVNLAIGARLVNGWARQNDSHGLAQGTRYGMGAEIPLRVEYFFSPAFAIGAAVGITMVWSGNSANPLTGSSKSFDLTLTRGDFSGGLGFTYYFQ